MVRILWLFFILMLLYGCASNDPIRNAKVSTVTVDIAKLEPDAVRGEAVRWGGSIIGIKNGKDYTLVEVLSRPLDRSGEPDDRKQGLGRFIAKLPGFVDPADYQQPNRITVVGVLEGKKEKKVGEYLYPYPVVIAEHHSLWLGNKPELRPSPYYYDPYWGSPWGPWGPWPYRHHPYW